MRLKGRLRRLEAQVAWLSSEGELRACALRLEALEKMQEISDHLARDPAAAARWKAAGFSIALPPPRVSERRFPLMARLEPAAALPLTAPLLLPGERSPMDASDLSSSAAPPTEERRGKADIPEMSDQAPLDPPEHMQIRPITWRIRGPDDWDDDEGDDGKLCPLDEEYDVLADA
ncbi:hypothetical protein SAMN02745126_04641 [Enhydrobacter aerosaccus]|uniref:Uncharacterized protein n=1 Tax=Enhydrobacter aerosaccus TaxID=225324 RepID=A0A1T4SHA7_9HYPH|nr:hypothetical protein [Enhydrobacter aerosaccus]SKA27328.1 hypothetical protein SAMN02745126_04641 [Enhydrobacter aerosaccus]